MVRVVLPGDVRLGKVSGPMGPNLAPKVTIIIKGWRGEEGCVRWRDPTIMITAELNSHRGLICEGTRAECRPTIWICCDDEIHCCGGTQCASLKLNNAIFFSIIYYIKGQRVHLPFHHCCTVTVVCGGSQGALPVLYCLSPYTVRTGMLDAAQAESQASFSWKRSSAGK